MSNVWSLSVISSAVEWPVRVLKETVRRLKAVLLKFQGTTQKESKTEMKQLRKWNRKAVKSCRETIFYEHGDLFLNRA